jgi:hypothetical protein
MKQARTWLMLMVLLAIMPALAKPEMKTESSTAKGAVVTVIHFGAPW